MLIRAKFMLTDHTETLYGGGGSGHVFVFRPQYDPSIPEDQRFAKATPSGELSISVDNPAVVEEWRGKMGQQFYLDLTPA